MPSFKEITQAVFSSWIERRQQVTKESRERSADHGGDSAAVKVRQAHNSGKTRLPVARLSS